MISCKKNNMFFFFEFFLCLLNINAQIKENPDNFPPNDLPHIKNNDFDVDQIREKDICLMEENNKLKIQIEVYNIYLKFLIGLNVLFVIALISFLIYKICCKNKEIPEPIEDINDEISLKYIVKRDNKELINNKEGEIDKSEDMDNSYNEELLNKSGLEAPPVSKILEQ